MQITYICSYETVWFKIHDLIKSAYTSVNNTFNLTYNRKLTICYKYMKKINAHLRSYSNYFHCYMYMIWSWIKLYHKRQRHAILMYLFVLALGFISAALMGTMVLYETYIYLYMYDVCMFVLLKDIRSRFFIVKFLNYNFV